VAGRIGDDEPPDRRREEAICDVDSDALLALGLESIDEQREVDTRALSAEARRFGLERPQLIVEDVAGLVQQSADERGLAVIDAAAREQAQKRDAQK
jgi:hypothetical protein